MPILRDPEFDSFIIDSRKYASMPSALQAEFDALVAVNKFRSLQGTAFGVVGARAEIAAPIKSLRKGKTQRWRVSFDSSSPLPIEMADHLQALHDMDQPFLLQFDVEMSRYPAVLSMYSASDRIYMTPTWPIMPYGHSPGDGAFDWSGHLFVNNVEYTGSATIYPDEGIVVFDASSGVSENSVIELWYSWIAYVRIVEIETSPLNTISQYYYQGSIALEQVWPMPDVTARNWDDTSEAPSLAELNRLCFGAFSYTASVTGTIGTADLFGKAFAGFVYTLGEAGITGELEDTSSLFAVVEAPQ